MPRIKSKIKTTVKDMGYEKAMDAIKVAKGHPFVKVGVLQKDAGKKRQGDKFTLAQVAAVQEFGSSNGNIPERSYIRSTMDEKRKEISFLSDKLIGQILAGKMTVSRALKIMGLDIAAKIKGKITNLREPANAPSTVRRKGSSNPLVDTGRLRSSINSKVEDAS